MKKIVVVFLLILFPLNIFALDIDLNSKSAIVVNRENNEILYEENINQKYEVASLTKIMTTIVALENITDLDEKIVISWDDVNIPYDYVTIGLQVGMEISYKDLLYTTIIYSAADSATALANNVFDDYSKFIDKMNELANKLNMDNSHFSNPVGFDDNNYSTSYDIYLLLDYALDNQNFYDIYTTKKYYIEVLDKQIGNGVLNSINKYNIETKGISFNGTKTGYTDYAGLCFSGITKLDNNELIVITLGADVDFEAAMNIVDSINLASYYDEFYSNRVILNKDKLIDNIVYKKGYIEYNYEIRSSKDVTYYMNNTLDLQYLKIYYDGVVNIDNSYKENDKLGVIKVYYEDKLLYSEDVLFSESNIIKDNNKDYKNLIIFVGICLLGLFIFRKKK